MLAVRKDTSQKAVRFLKSAAVGAALLCLSPLSANAVVVIDGATLLGFFAGNDCEGGAFADCYATQTGANVVGGLLPSSVIYKINSDTTTDTGNYASITGSEFALTYVSDVLSWTYTPGTGDPAIHYFDIKQGNGYALFYSASDLTAWSDNILTDLGYNGYSHVTWFDGALESSSSSGGSTSSSGGSSSSSGGSTSSSTSGGPGPGEVPEPAALGLLGAGLLGLGLLRRRQKLD